MAAPTTSSNPRPQNHSGPAGPDFEPEGAGQEASCGGRNRTIPVVTPRANLGVQARLSRPGRPNSRALRSARSNAAQARTRDWVKYSGCPRCSQMALSGSPRFREPPRRSWKRRPRRPAASLKGSAARGPAIGAARVSRAVTASSRTERRRRPRTAQLSFAPAWRLRRCPPPSRPPWSQARSPWRQVARPCF